MKFRSLFKGSLPLFLFRQLAPCQSLFWPELPALIIQLLALRNQLSILVPLRGIQNAKLKIQNLAR